MSELTRNCVLRLAPGCRFSTAADPQDNLLLIPEGALRLKGPSRAILELCNGERPLDELVQELARRYPPEQAARIESETHAFVAQMRDRGILEVV
ncbi:MAG TPA: pyrroloquinoline quinone biosynthesis peptide chaperone PqqD [Terriglobia bacterium]